LAQRVGLGRAPRGGGGRVGLADRRGGLGLGQALRLGGLGLGQPALLDRVGLGLADLDLGQARRGREGLLALGHADLGAGLHLRGLLGGLGLGQALAGQVLGRGLGGLGGLDVLDQVLLGLGLGEDDDLLALALGLLGGAQALDALFLLGDGLLDGDALADDVGDVALLGFELLVRGDAGQFLLAFASDDLEDAVLLDPLGLDGDDTLAVLLGDGDLAQPVLVLDPGGLFGLDARGLGLEPLLGLHLLDLGVLAGAECLDLALLADLGLLLAALELEHGLAGLDVLALDLLLLVAPVLVRGDRLAGGQLGDLADALGVEDVLRVERGHRGLLEVVDGRVLERVAVEVGPDDVDDAVAELVAVGVEIGEVELLADGLERLGELGVEQLLERVLVGGALGADRVGDIADVVGGGVDADEERDRDVGPDVVLTDQAVLARTVN